AVSELRAHVGALDSHFLDGCGRLRLQDLSKETALDIRAIHRNIRRRVARARYENVIGDKNIAGRDEVQLSRAVGNLKTSGNALRHNAWRHYGEVQEVAADQRSPRNESRSDVCRNLRRRRGE